MQCRLQSIVWLIPYFWEYFLKNEFARLLFHIANFWNLCKLLHFFSLICNHINWIFNQYLSQDSLYYSKCHCRGSLQEFYYCKERILMKVFKNVKPFLCWYLQKRIQNSVKRLRWSVLQNWKGSIVDVLQGSECFFNIGPVISLNMVMIRSMKIKYFHDDILCHVISKKIEGQLDYCTGW